MHDSTEIVKQTLTMRQVNIFDRMKCNSVSVNIQRALYIITNDIGSFTKARPGKIKFNMQLLVLSNFGCI